MSGGFFRGTSADQDTRFSNKQAKLLKSQKFAPELDHLVDMTKVKKEVMEPWIARRVTELLGFEDEVLINFIYTLLEGKEVNGKEVQIALTGFMEKNTGKFMKELWTLLLSAQQNVSGVPQHLLDAKAEEVQRKQAYDDQITTRIEKIREEESKELQLGRLKKMDDGVETKATNFDMELASRGLQPKGSTAHPGDDEDVERRNGLGGRNRKSRSESRSPEGKRRSISSDWVNRSSRGRSNTPKARHSSKISLSPSRRRSYSRQRSRSPLGSRSPSPIQRRFGSYHHRSPLPMRRRSPSPVRHRRSPSPDRRHRSPSPIRHRRSPSPIRRRRSPSPIRRRRSPSPVGRPRSPSPLRRRRSPSPVRRRRSPSPFQQRSPSLECRRSPSPIHGKSPSPVHRDTPSPVRQSSVSPLPGRYQRSPLTSHSRSVSPAQRSPIPSRQRLQTPHDGSASPYGSSSPSPIRRKSSPLSRKAPKEYRISPAQTMKEKVRARQNLSSTPRRPSSPLRSPLRDPKDKKDSRHEVPAPSPSPDVSPRQPKSPTLARTKRLSGDQRSSTPDEVIMRQRRQRLVHDGSSALQRSREQNARNASPEISKEVEEAEHIRERRDYKSRSSQKPSAHSPAISKGKDSPVRVHNKNDQSSERLSGRSQHGDKSEKSSRRGVDSGASYVRISPMLSHTSLLGKKQAAFKEAGKRSDERNRGSANNVKDSHRGHESETPKMVVAKVDQTNGGGALNSDSEEIGKRRTENKEKRKHKRSHRRELTSEGDESYDSEIEDRKEAKRRRKEEKKLRKEKRRRREERRRRKEKEERRAEKLKLKDNSDINSSDYENAGRPDSHQSDNEEAHDEQKKLEIELRKKALELYKAKKGISH